MSDPRKFKSDIRVEGDIQLPNETASRVIVVDGSGEIASSNTTTTELSYLEGVTSSVQDQIDAAQTAAADAQQAIDDHIADTTGAHAASAISVTPAGDLTSTDAQSAFEELQDDIDALEALVAALPDPIYYAGTWNASTNTPTLDNTDTDAQGALYYVTVAGTVDFGAGAIEFAIGDKVVNNGTTWDKWDNTDQVLSVNGQTGVVVLDTGDVAESGNLYFTDERAQDAVGTILTDSNTIDFTYNDATPSIVADVKTQMSLTSDASGIKLVGDEASPGNTQYYGTDGSGNKGFYPIVVGSAGDIPETSFAIANDQSVAADVTGFAFDDASVRSFSALVSVEIDATADLFEEFHIQGINKNGTFNMSVDGVGDNSGIVFSITNAGQIQYTGLDYAGFVSGTIRFRAITTNFA